MSDVVMSFECLIIVNASNLLQYVMFSSLPLFVYITSSAKF